MLSESHMEVTRYAQATVGQQAGQPWQAGGGALDRGVTSTYPVA